MNTFQAITNRRSIRQYQNKPVPRDDLLMCIEMGMHAPTSGDLQEVRFILVEEKETINKLPPICLDQYWITSAPALIIVCSQPEVQDTWYGQRGRHVFATQDAAAAIQNVLLAATDLGLATCWISGFDQEQVNDLFSVGDARVEAIITIGYADETSPKKDINPINTSVYFEKYGNDKYDLIALNKDYSIKLEKKINELDKQTQTFREKAKQKINELQQQAKSIQTKQVLKKSEQDTSQEK